MVIYKILRADDWAGLRTNGTSPGAAVDIADGFVHFSTAKQLAETLARHFHGEAGLVLLACDSKSLEPDLTWEPSRGGDLFPHLYRPLAVTDILWTREINLGPNGHETGPLE